MTDQDLIKAQEMIKKYEGFRSHAYQDAVGVWTIGYGCTQGVVPGMIITIDYAERMLAKTVAELGRSIYNMVTVPLNSNQVCALIDFCYNLGLGSLHHSRLLTELNSGSSAQTVAQQFLLWDHAGGKVLRGLTIRRQAEAALFLTVEG